MQNWHCQGCKAKNLCNCILHNQFTIQKTLGLFNVKFVFCLFLFLCKYAVVTFNHEVFMSYFLGQLLSAGGEKKLYKFCFLKKEKWEKC